MLYGKLTETVQSVSHLGSPFRAGEMTGPGQFEMPHGNPRPKIARRRGAA